MPTPAALLSLQPAVDLGKGVLAIEARFPGAEQIQVRPVQDQYRSLSI
jgi:hypothetical protein